MLNIEDLEFQKLDIQGVRTLINWADKEGWNPGPHDADVYFQTDPEGFYGYHHNNELIAGGAIISYGGQFGFMGLFIVKPEYRAMGIGKKLWFQRRDTLLSRLNPGAAIGMDGVVAMQPFYQKGGFKPAFRDERHERTGEPFEISPHISAITDDDLSKILKYDEMCFGFPRPQFMKHWLKLPGSYAFKYHDGELRGFVNVRKADEGYKVCPLFADNFDVAEELYKACLNAVKGHKLYLDIPVTNEDAQKLIKKYRTSYVFECARMYYGNAPDLPISKIFGLTTFEIG